MKALSRRLGIAITGLLLAAGPALAQGGGDRGNPADRNPGDRGGSTTSPGGGAPAGVGGGGGGVGGGGGGSETTGGGSSVPSHWLTMPSNDWYRKPKPDKPKRTPKSDGPGAPLREDTAGPRFSESTPTVWTRDVPTWSRPKGDRPATGEAVPRIGPLPPHDCDVARSRVYLQCSEPVPVYLYPSIGFGTWFPWGGFGPLYSEAYFVPYMTEYDGQITGRLKVKVKPRTARVFVDGFYVGIVDEFDGALQKLTLNGGAHKIVISADGYETIELDVYISYTRTVTIVREMKRVP